MKKKLFGLMLALCLMLEAIPADMVLAAEAEPGTASQEVSEDAVPDKERESEQEDTVPAESEEKKENVPEESKEEEDITPDTAEVEEDIEISDDDTEEGGTEIPEENGKDSSADTTEAEKQKKDPQNEEQDAKVSVLADTEDYGDLSEYDVYLANQLINYGRYDFMTQEYESACEILVRNGKENGLSSGIAAWRALTFDGASEVEYAEAEVAYYEAILFDLVYDENEEGLENTVYDNIMDASEAVKASNWKKMCEGGQEVLMNMPVSADNLDEVYSAIQACDSVQGILDKVSLGTDILGYVDTGKELLDKLSELSVLTSVSDETQEIISDMAKSYNEADAMKVALGEYSVLLSGLLDEATIFDFLAGRTTLEMLSEQCVKGLWDTVITKMNSAGLAIEVGQTVGKMASNFLVSTDATIENFYSMEAMTKFTEAFTSQVRTYGERFKSNPSVENARKFNAAFEMLYKAHVINLDYAKKFLDQVHTEGFINYLFNGSEDEDYRSSLRSIESMRKDFSTFMDAKKASAYSLYQEEFPNNIETNLKDVEIEQPVSEEQLVVIEDEIEELSKQISDVTISEDTTFNADSDHFGNITLEDGVLDLNGYDMTVFGDLYIKGGTLRLSGGHLTVNGNVYHTNGLLYLSGGTLEVSKNYNMGSNTTDGQVNTSSGEIRMEDAGDRLKVAGDFYMYSSHGSYIQWTKGVTEIGGSLYKYHSFSGSNTGISGSHKTIFTGNSDLTISSAGLGRLAFANTEIQNAANRKITWKGSMNFSGSLAVDSESLEINAEELDVQITGWEGKPLKVIGDVKYTGGMLDMSGEALEVTGNLNVAGGEINLNGGKLTCGKGLTISNSNGLLNLNGGTGKVTGDVSHTNGTLYMNGGTLEVSKNYNMGSNTTDGQVNTSSGEIRMEDAGDRLKVAGDFYMYSSHGSYIQWTKGVTEIGGSLYKYHSFSGSNTGISGSHKTIFTGNSDLTISSAGLGRLAFANTEIQNAADRKITLKGDIQISGRLSSDSDNLRISAQDAVLSGAGFSDLNLIVDSDLTYNSGTWSLNGKNLQVNGDVYQKGGILNLGKGSLAVSGSYYHQGGTLNPSGGSVEIGGNYYNAVPSIDSSSGDPVYNTSSGLLYMNNASSFMNVAGDFVVASNQSHSGKLTDGTIAIQGDFTQVSGNAYNFACDENMTVILNGKDVQYVSFANPNSKFNILQLTKDKDTGYVFSPDPCWNELEEIRDEFAILVQPEDCAAIEGGEAVFT